MAHVISFHDSSKEFEKKEWEDYVIYIPESREYLDSLHKMIEFVGNLPLNGTESCSFREVSCILQRCENE